MCFFWEMELTVFLIVTVFHGRNFWKMTTNPNIPEHHGLPFPLDVVLRTNDHVDEWLKASGISNLVVVLNSEMAQ